MTQAYAIIDLQFGSTGKGLLAGYLANKLQPDAIVTNWSPNAGHTFIDSKNGNKYIHTMLANGVVSDSVERVFIGPGSNVDLKALIEEIKAFDQMNPGNEPFDIYIHENAGIVLPEHREQEETDKAMIGIGSTRKGVGAAVANKVRRDPSGMATVGQWYEADGSFVDWLSDNERIWLDHAIVKHSDYIEKLNGCTLIQMEGCQGYSLGINSGMYPYTTSRECTVMQLMSDCLIPPRWLMDTYGCARTFPIRVANRFNDEGDMIGYSGPGYEDQTEIEWKDINVEPELTTVTKLPRRIFTFSPTQFEEALQRNSVTKVFMNFMNYLDETEHQDNYQFTQAVMKACMNQKAVWALQGWGPADDNISDDGEANMDNIIRLTQGADDASADS